VGSLLSCLPCFKKNPPTHSPCKKHYAGGPDSPGTAARNRATALSQDVNAENLDDATITKPIGCLSWVFSKEPNPSEKSQVTGVTFQVTGVTFEDTVDSKASTMTPSDKPANNDICI